MSTNKSTEESQSNLVPALDWFDALPSDKQLEYANNYWSTDDTLSLKYDEILHIYLKEHTVKEDPGTKDPVRPVLDRFYALQEEEQAAIRVMYTHDNQGLSFERFLISLEKEEGDLVLEEKDTL